MSLNGRVHLRNSLLSTRVGFVTRKNSLRMYSYHNSFWHNSSAMGSISAFNSCITSVTTCLGIRYSRNGGVWLTLTIATTSYTSFKHKRELCDTIPSLGIRQRKKRSFYLLESSEILSGNLPDVQLETILKEK